MLNQIQESKRIIFLREFTEELIKSSINIKQSKPKEIEIIKLRQKFIEPSSPEKAMEKVSQIPFLKSKYTKELNPRTDFIKSQEIEKIHEIPYVHNPEIKKQDLTNLRKPIFKRIRIPRQRLRTMVQKPFIKNKPENIIQTRHPQIIIPEPAPMPEGFNLGKLQQFINDNAIQSIECTGPGKPIFVKTFGRTNSTRVTLSIEEIKQIIEEFSKHARIPPVRGILKAGVGNLIISAVSSEYVGSRFIINKISPIYQNNPQK